MTTVGSLVSATACAQQPSPVDPEQLQETSLLLLVLPFMHRIWIMAHLCSSSFKITCCRFSYVAMLNEN